MTHCTKENLALFSTEQFTYINQIFGDETVREAIKETYAKRDWKFLVEPASEEFDDDSDHHFLEKKGKNGKTVKWCSVDEGFQNTDINPNDTLCQSYTLLKYLKKPIVGSFNEDDMKQRQMAMIQMYRNIMKRDKFTKILQEIVEVMNDEIKKLNKKTEKKKNPSIWRDYTYQKPYPYLKKDFNTISAEIHSVLDKWENYGYWHFIKKGTCPTKK